MKSSFRGFMCGCLWLLVAAVTVSVSQGAVVITTVASVGPAPTSPSYDGYTGQALSCLSTGAAPATYPVSMPYLYSVAPASLNWGDICIDNSGRRVWEGQIISDPSSPFYNEKGTAYYVNAIFIGDGVHKITASSIGYQITTSDLFHQTATVGTFAGLTYGVDPIIGISYGADGVRSADDIVYGVGNPAPDSTPVDMVILIGAPIAYDATSSGLDFVQNYVDSDTPLSFTTIYSIDDGTDVYLSSQAIEVVPEPATLGLVGLGLAALIRRRHRK